MEVTVLCFNECIMRAKISHEFKSKNNFIIISSFDLDKDVNSVGFEDGQCIAYRFVDETHGEYVITIKEATEIIEFIEKTIECGKDLVVSCDGGVSRSAAIGAFAELAYADTNTIFTDDTKCPNQRVLATLMLAYSMKNNSIDEKLLDRLFLEYEHNEAIYAKAHFYDF